MNAASLALIFGLSGCSETEVEDDRVLTLVYQNNIGGDIEPCG